QWSDELLARYFAEQDAQAMPRPRLSLPWSATHAAPALAEDVRVCLTAPRPLAFKIEDGVVEFECNKKRWRFAAAALHVLRLLAQTVHRGVRLRALRAVVIFRHRSRGRRPHDRRCEHSDRAALSRLHTRPARQVLREVWLCTLQTYASARRDERLAIVARGR